VCKVVGEAVIYIWKEDGRHLADADACQGTLCSSFFPVYAQQFLFQGVPEGNAWEALSTGVRRTVGGDHVFVAGVGVQ